VIHKCKYSAANTRNKQTHTTGNTRLCTGTGQIIYCTVHDEKHWLDMSRLELTNSRWLPYQPTVHRSQI